MMANKQTKAQIMNGIDCVSSKIYANNTVKYMTADGTTVYRLHNTDIVSVKKGVVTLNTGGWNTVTTFARMNTIMNDLKLNWHVSQRKGEAIIYTRYGAPTSELYALVDGLKIMPDGNIQSKFKKLSEAQFKKNAKMLKKVDDYISHVKKVLMTKGVPQPNGGDCWFCLMHTEDRKTLGGATNDNEHLLMHMKEKYVPGALIWNAVKEAGYNPQFHCSTTPYTKMDFRGSVVLKATKRYIKRRVGLAP